MQFVMFCFTDCVCYCLTIYVPSINKNVIIMIRFADLKKPYEDSSNFTVHIGLMYYDQYNA